MAFGNIIISLEHTRDVRSKMNALQNSMCGVLCLNCMGDIVTLTDINEAQSK